MKPCFRSYLADSVIASMKQYLRDETIKPKFEDGWEEGKVFKVRFSFGDLSATYEITEITNEALKAMLDKVMSDLKNALNQDASLMDKE
jgi:hypothetical protein